MMQRNKPGYVLIITIIILTAVMALVTSVVYRTMGQRSLIRLFQEQEKSYMLALGGIEIAQAQLSAVDQKTTTTGGQKSPDAQAQAFALALLTTLNQWQTFNLTEEADGVDGQIKIYVTAEQGKIDINALYDRKNKKLVTDAQYDARKIMQLIADQLKPIAGDINIVDMLDRSLRQYEGQLDEVSQLLIAKELAKFNDFLWPDPARDKKKVPFAITDLFTVATGERKVQPLVFSPGLKTLLGLKESGDKKEQQKIYKDIAKSVKASINWPLDWDKMLAPLYGKRYTDIPTELRAILDPAFKVSVFSVVAYGIFGTTTTKLCAIVERKSEDDRISYTTKKLFRL